MAVKLWFHWTITKAKETMDLARNSVGVKTNMVYHGNFYLTNRQVLMRNKCVTKKPMHI